MLSKIIYDIFWFVLAGIAIGDCVGSGLEGRHRRKIKSILDLTKHQNLRSEEYSAGYKLGDYSDDTSDTIAIINTIMGGDFTMAALLHHIEAQYNLSKLDRDGIPRAGFGSIAWVFEGKKTIDVLRAFQSARDYPGNAPAMRAIPIGFLEKEKIESAAITNADVTHPHPKCRAASLLVAHATHYLLFENGNQADIIAHCKNFVADVDRETYDYLGKIDQLPADVDHFDDSSSDVSPDYELLVGPQPITSFMDGSQIVGLNSDAMRTAGTALYLIKHCKSPFEALKRSMWIGGDVDSLAAIVVGILAGKYGISEFPAFMLNDMERGKGRHVLESLAKQFWAFMNAQKNASPFSDCV